MKKQRSGFPLKSLLPCSRYLTPGNFVFTFTLCSFLAPIWPPIASRYMDTKQHLPFPNSIIFFTKQRKTKFPWGQKTDLKSLDRKVVRVQSPLWAPKQNERVTIQIHTRLLFKISPLTLVVAIANANRRGLTFFPPSFPSPPPSAPQPLRTRRHVFLHTLWAGSAYFPWGVGGASRASGGHPGSLSISAG